jgi:hypothetical protein
MTWADAMGLVVLEGILILILVLTGFRTAVFHAVPTQLKTAISVGIGLFIALIGFVDAGFVRRTATGPVPVQLGTDGFINGWPTFVFVLGLVLVVILWVRKVKRSDPHRHRGHDDPRDHRRGHRQDRPDGRRRQGQPDRLGARRPGDAQGHHLDAPVGHAWSLLAASAPSSGSASSRPSC